MKLKLTSIESYESPDQSYPEDNFNCYNSLYLKLTRAPCFPAINVLCRPIPKYFRHSEIDTTFIFFDFFGKN